jgi:hypothetical protein
VNGKTDKWCFPIDSHAKSSVVIIHEGKISGCSLRYLMGCFMGGKVDRCSVHLILGQSNTGEENIETSPESNVHASSLKDRAVFETEFLFHLFQIAIIERNSMGKRFRVCSVSMHVSRE